MCVCVLVFVPIKDVYYLLTPLAIISGFNWINIHLFLEHWNLTYAVVVAVNDFFLFLYNYCRVLNVDALPSPLFSQIYTIDVGCLE